MEKIEFFLENFSVQSAELYHSIKKQTIDYIIICKNPISKLKSRIIGKQFHHNN